MKGGCQCGFVRYELDGEPGALTVCHCKECQRQSGSAFGMSLAASRASLELACGTLKTFKVKCDSGRTKICAFCPECGTRIFHQIGENISVKAGTLDDVSTLKPDSHYWTRRKLSWVTIPSGIPQFSDDG